MASVALGADLVHPQSEPPEQQGDSERKESKPKPDEHDLQAARFGSSNEPVLSKPLTTDPSQPIQPSSNLSLPRQGLFAAGVTANNQPSKKIISVSLRENLLEGDLLLDKVAGVVGKKPKIVNIPAVGTDPIDFSELEAYSRLIAANANTFEASGTLNRTNYLDPLAGPSGYAVTQNGDAVNQAILGEARLKRVLATQERATELHFANRKDDLVGISQLIDADEKILHRLPTVGYDPFPHVEEQLLFGHGEIILTDKRIIMTYAGDKMEASGQESRFDGVAGCCLSMFQYQTVTGKYEHLAHREFVSHVAVIDVQRQLCSAVTDHADQLDLVRKAHFENEKDAKKCCKFEFWCPYIRCCCLVCCFHIYCCYTGKCSKYMAGGSDFSYSTGINSDSKAGSSVQDLIKEYKVGADPGSWSAFEIETIKSIANPESDDEWEILAADLPGGRTAKELKEKYQQIKEGVTLFESCRVGRYRAVTLKYWDPVDPRLAREVACYVDPEVSSLLELHSFSISAMKLVSMRQELPTANKMGGDLEILSAPTSIRDQVLKRGDKGMSLSNFFGGSADMHQVRKGKMDAEAKKKRFLFC